MWRDLYKVAPLNPLQVWWDGTLKFALMRLGMSALITARQTRKTRVIVPISQHALVVEKNGCGLRASAPCVHLAVSHCTLSWAAERVDELTCDWCLFWLRPYHKIQVQTCALLLLCGVVISTVLLYHFQFQYESHVCQLGLFAFRHCGCTR